MEKLRNYKNWWFSNLTYVIPYGILKNVKTLVVIIDKIIGDLLWKN